MKRLTAMFLRNFSGRNCERNIGEGVLQCSRKKSHVMKWKLLSFTYVCDRVCAGGGGDAGVTA